MSISLVLKFHSKATVRYSAMCRTIKANSIGKFFLLLKIYAIYIGYISAAEIDELRYCLLDLKLSELLRLQHSMESMKTASQWLNSSLTNQTENQKSTEEYSKNATTEIKDSCSTQNCMKPMAMALTGQPRGYYGSTVYHHHHSWQPEEKQSKLTTLFNVSITALAFLSFGGYLLCLIVQAIKSKGTTYFHPIATASTTTTNGSVKRIKIYRRGRRETTVDNYNGVWVMNHGYGHLF